MTRWVDSVSRKGVQQPSIAVSDDTAVPVYKAGLVLLRDMQSGDPEVFLAQVKPKREGDVPDFGLPKGTRKYYYHNGEGKKKYRDVSGPEEAVKEARHLEPLHRTLMAEADEEAGINRRTMRHAEIHELGPRAFTSRKGKSFEIQWYVVEASDLLVNNMHKHPKDAQAGRWLRLSALEVLVDKADAGQAKPGENINRSYLDVAREAAQKLRAGELARFEIPFGPQAGRV